MTTKRPENQPCRLVSLCGQFLTVNGTFSADPARALTAERWYIEREQRRINTATIILRA
jgi:hypothetical protein